MDFQDVKTYRDLQDSNILFLEGGLNRTPYHHGPVDPETIPLLNDLVNINDLGFISVMGQPALNDVKFVDKTWTIPGSSQIRGNWWYQVMQRSFIEGYLPKAYLETFIEFMDTQPDYYYRVYDIQSGWFSSVRLVEIKDTFPSSFFNITKERVSYDLQTLDQAQWEYYSNITADMTPPFDFSGYPNIVKVMIPHTVKIIISSRGYNSGSVEQLLLNFFYSLHKIMGN
jgi:hypothetical protein